MIVLHIDPFQTLLSSDSLTEQDVWSQLRWQAHFVGGQRKGCKTRVIFQGNLHPNSIGFYICPCSGPVCHYWWIFDGFFYHALPNRQKIARDEGKWEGIWRRLSSLLWRSLPAQASVWEFHMAGSESGGTQHKVQLSNDSFMQVSIVPVQSIKT